MENVATALAAAIQLTLQLQKIQQLLATAHSEGRDITSDELKSLQAEDDAARLTFQSAIDAAKARGQ